MSSKPFGVCRVAEEEHKVDLIEGYACADLLCAALIRVQVKRYRKAGRLETSLPVTWVAQSECSPKCRSRQCRTATISSFFLSCAINAIFIPFLRFLLVTCLRSIIIYTNSRNFNSLYFKQRHSVSEVSL